MEKVERAAEPTTAGEFVDAAAEDQDAIAHLFGEGATELRYVLVEFAAGLHHEFRGGGRR